MSCVPYVYIDAEDSKWYVATGQAEVGPFDTRGEAETELKVEHIQEEQTEDRENVYDLLRAWPFV